ncbi:hypothetical protein Poly30_30400 [Planctomycetes bacterium Poly30]|uniref:Peptidase family S51 n=1 Tax=Saltatorellus ferox TaxID=2528018 RepID=A0A518ETU7_9BACT|nr:hypothetical protein Poly30_30400 [Planctomycetes bacterium Poly30]
MVDPANEAARKIAILGPQHANPILREVLDSESMPGPYVLVAAGWEEREAETGSLESHLGVSVQNLGAWPACETAFEKDSELKKLMFARYDRMRELTRVYRVRMSAELGALRTLFARTNPAAPDDLVGPELEPAFEALRALDDLHRGRVAALNDETFARAHERDSLREGTERMAEMLAGAGTLLIAGGHVGILYNRMRLFRVLDHLNPGAGIAGWSAGGMVLTDTLLLFHDSPPRGAGDAEVHGPGFGIAHGIVALPHASTRLHLDDQARVAILSRRMAPALVTALDGGQCALLGGAGEWSFRGGARLLRPGGQVEDASDSGREPALSPGGTA